MSLTWDNGERPKEQPITLAGWARVVVRGTVLAVLVFGGLGLSLLIRCIEAPLYRTHRPWTPWLTQVVCIGALWILGLRVTRVGRPMSAVGAMVANHSSWLDIFVLNAGARIYFVSKAEVAGWPGIGWLARATGTVFITRDPRAAAAQRAQLQDRLNAGHLLLFFPEGTSTDGQQVLPFKSTLFSAFYAPAAREGAMIQPVSVVYQAPLGADPRYYGWWGDMSFGPHLVKTLAAGRGGGVRVTYHAPIAVADMPDRKAMATSAEAAVRAGHGVA